MKKLRRVPGVVAIGRPAARRRLIPGLDRTIPAGSHARAMTAMRDARAWWRAPAQLLNVLEWAHEATACTGRPRPIVVLARATRQSRLQLRRMSDIARETGVEVVHWHEPRLGGASTARTVRSLAGELSGIDAAGDRRPVLRRHAGRPQRQPAPRGRDRRRRHGHPGVRPAVGGGRGPGPLAHPSDRGQRRQIVSFARGQLAYSARRRMTAGAGCRLSCSPACRVELDKVPVTTNDFAWVRSRYAAPDGQGRRRHDRHLAGRDRCRRRGVLPRRRSAGSPRTHRLDRYFAHRKEGADKLARIEALGLRGRAARAAAGDAARLGPVGATVVSFPSTVVHTLPLVLADTAVEAARLRHRRRAGSPRTPQRRRAASCPGHEHRP